MKTEIKLITPSEARELLNRNVNNRCLNKFVVDRYARDMEEGRWEDDSPNPIILGENGNLKDGQHRLSAVIKSNTSIKFLIVTVSDEIFNIDNGLSRSTKDVYRLKYGEDVNNTIWGAVVLKLTKGDFKKHPTKSEQIKAYEKDAKQWNKSYLISTKGSSSPAFKNSPTVLAIFNALSCGVNEEILEEFARVINTGLSNGEHQNSAIILRNEAVVKKNLSARGGCNRWAYVGFVEEYIRLFAENSRRTRRINDPTWYYTKRITDY